MKARDETIKVLMKYFAKINGRYFQEKAIAGYIADELLEQSLVRMREEIRKAILDYLDEIDGTMLDLWLDDYLNEIKK